MLDRLIASSPHNVSVLGTLFEYFDDGATLSNQVESLRNSLDHLRQKMYGRPAVLTMLYNNPPLCEFLQVEQLVRLEVLPDNVGKECYRVRITHRTDGWDDALRGAWKEVPGAEIVEGPGENEWTVTAIVS